MLAIDVVSVALVVGVLALAATSVISSTAVGPLSVRRRSRRSPELPPVRQRRVVTGPPAIDRDWLSPPVVPRHVPPAPDVQVDAERLREAADLVDYLIVNDPAHLARLVAQVLERERLDAADDVLDQVDDLIDVVRDVIVMPPSAESTR